MNVSDSSIELGHSPKDPPPFFVFGYTMWQTTIWKWPIYCWQEWRVHTSGNAMQDKLKDDGFFWVGGDNGGWMQHLSALRHPLNMAVMCDVRGEHPGACKKTQWQTRDGMIDPNPGGWRNRDRITEKQITSDIKVGPTGNASAPPAKMFGITIKSQKRIHYSE